MHMADNGETKRVSSTVSPKTICVSFMAASEPWEHITCGTRLLSETLKSVSTVGEGRSPIERTIRQKVHEVIQLYHTIDRTAKW
jgi:hypothetical protein